MIQQKCSILRKITSIAGINRCISSCALLLLCCFCIGCSSASAVKEPYPLHAEQIQKDTEYLCHTIGIRPAGTSKETEACDWIAGELYAAGFSASDSFRRSSFSGFQRQKSENVIAICNSGFDGPLFSIIAHYDSVETSPGARDNAASVAALLEIARYLGPENTAFPCEIRMVFLGSEENGYHGSAAYVSSLSDQEKSRHLGAFNMDISAASPEEKAVPVLCTLGGRKDGSYQEGDFLEPAENAVSRSVREAFQTLYGTDAVGTFHQGESDHISFHQAELDSANICWRRLENGEIRLPESYHKESDTPDGLDYETIRASARCILEAIHRLSASPQS